MFIRKNNKKYKKRMDSRGIEPRTSPMRTGNYTTKPQAHLIDSDVEGSKMALYPKELPD